MKHRKIIHSILVLALVMTTLCGCGKKYDRVPETDTITQGIDVARYQGTIDWQQVADSGIDFARSVWATALRSTVL